LLENRASVFICGSKQAFEYKQCNAMTTVFLANFPVKGKEQTVGEGWKRGKGIPNQLWG
jgi:hypothetical protein